MLISYKYKFLFVHIAKTGGTSIRAALRKYKWPGPYRVPLFVCSMLDQATRHRMGIKFPRHAKAIAAKEMLPDELYDELFKFTVVRNPFDLQVSSYYHMQKEKAWAMEGIDSFDQFIRRKFDPERGPIEPFDISSQLMSDYVVDLHGVQIVDFIAKYENLQRDFETICRHIGVPAPQLPHLRRAESRNGYREYYTPELRGIVERHYAKDLELFGYAF